MKFLTCSVARPAAVGQSGGAVQVHHKVLMQTNATAWDMNDSGALQDRTLHAVLYDGPSAPGQTAQLALGFLESDGQHYQSTVQAASELAI
jgi:hypothetical protein